MTETEWLECISPEDMLIYLGEQASSRKRRLFACACVRRIWPLLRDEHFRQVLKAAERFADGRVFAKDLEKARRIARRLRAKREARELRQTTWMTLAARAAAQAVEALLPEDEPILIRPRDIREPPDVVTATRTARCAVRAAQALREKDTPAVRETIRRLPSLDAVELIREIFGNPFRSVTLDPSWLGCKDGRVPKMAQIIYRKRCFRNLPLLAEALETAGCGDAEILTHCRAPVEHVRGCWVVDLLLGKK
jgi:hypothetical protein